MSLSREATSRRARLRLVLGMLISGTVAVSMLWVFRAETTALLKQAAAWTREAGPWAYFGAMATVPLPLAWFTVPAGELFAGQLSVPGVIAAAMGAVLAQLSLSYVAARYAMRPWLADWVSRRGYKVPVVTRGTATQVVLLVRLLPGPPMILGSCLLALAETPFVIYLGWSALVALPWVCAGVVLGKGVLAGNISLAATGAGLFAALVISVRLLKKRSASSPLRSNPRRDTGAGVAGDPS